MLSDDAYRVYRGISEYCETYNIPREHLLEILEDQKVLPMIRGKATEYIGVIVLRRTLRSLEWTVEKLNLNPQPGQRDEDIGVTFRRTGMRLKAETKNAVRGSFKLGTRMYPGPHFAVKCHRSRSHLHREYNDRYLSTEFDLLLSNVSNAIFRTRTLEPGLPLIEHTEAIEWLKQRYGVATDQELRRVAYDDWRACVPTDIAQSDGTLARTPRIRMDNDPHWFRLEQLEGRLKQLIDERSGR